MARQFLLIFKGVTGAHFKQAQKINVKNLAKVAFSWKVPAYAPVVA